ncbi:MAG: penicillin amidase [Arcticibacterium sp.]|jgi:penicillin amidase
MKILKALWPSLLLVSLLYLLGSSHGSVPALGKLFSPFTGFWQNAELHPLRQGSLDLKGLQEEVIIKYDKNRIPHIFAKNDADLYFAQGYTIASDRLWQMEFYTLVAAGRLTEVVGERALAYDQYNRRSGMAFTAEEIYNRMNEAPELLSYSESYAAGVNAYIASLKEKDLPIEYKMLGYFPEKWTPKKSMLILMNMRNQLNGGSLDFKMTRIAEKYGLEVVNELFPKYPKNSEPIIPNGSPLLFDPLPIPEIPNEIVAFPADKSIAMTLEAPRPEIGSNNWAVAGSKSASGLPILSNDPHLGLSFPSIWYQIQLHSPNVNVYGSVLPGVPGVTIGFNKDIAWGVTNVGPDVMDFFKIKFRDKAMNEYWHDGRWKKTTKRTEKYIVKGGETVTDTLISTHHGPVIYFENSKSNFNQSVPAGYAMQWITHDSSPGDLSCFIGLNKAKNYVDYREALTHYIAPAQNFIFASNENDIAITPNGKFPLKWDEQGKFLLDGTRKDHDWQGYLPPNHNPHVKNPERGYVSSANQSINNPADYPYYIDWTSADPYRGTQINKRLAAMEDATADSLRSIQNDNYSLAAEWFLPSLLKMLGKTETSHLEAKALLENWDFRNEADSKAATVFETWINILMEKIWDDEFPLSENFTYPTEDKTLQLILEEPNSKWFDDVKTKNKVESLKDIVFISFNQTIDSLQGTYGDLSETWEWYKIKQTGIRHLIPAFKGFSEEDLPNGGGKRIVNASTGRSGPSWRMIVELDKEWPRAYGVYPGGQSGNPGSKYYDNMVDTWTEGQLNELLFLKNVSEESSHILSSQKLIPSK